ncbi:MAG: GNAT family N-acetyltransferase [Clostridiales bacterium]|nr:GNAT family N-acetyltransferase [Clostridiales bacterium]
MQIRKMTIADYDEIYSLWLSCAGMGLNNLDDTKDGIARFLERNPETCFVALVDERIVGAIMVGTDGRRGYIYHTAVHPDYRKHGIAKTLVDTALSAVKNLGINKVALVVFGRNKDGNDFWEKMGFTTREDIVYRNKTLVEFVRIDT